MQTCKHMVSDCSKPIAPQKPQALQERQFGEANLAVDLNIFLFEIGLSPYSDVEGRNDKANTSLQIDWLLQY